MNDNAVLRNRDTDLIKLADAFFVHLDIDNIDFGGIGLDSKRPFGNSDVEGDILEIIEWEPEAIEDDGYRSYSTRQCEYAYALYQRDLIPFLKNVVWKAYKYSRR